MIVRLGYVQLWKGASLSEMAENSWRREIPFQAKRGEIVDRNGVRLAYNISSPTVWRIPAQIKDAPATARALAPVLGESENKLLAQLTKKAMYVDLKPAGRKITLEKAQQIRKLGLAGIVIGEDNKRYYPYEGLAAHLLGFTGGYNQGLTGLELRYDDRLSGLTGSVSFLADAAGRQMPHSSDRYKPPRDGLQLQLTIDQTIQSIVERELDEAMLRYQADSVSAIAMDPRNGEIIAMGSRPTFYAGQISGRRHLKYTIATCRSG